MLINRYRFAFLAPDGAEGGSGEQTGAQSQGNEGKEDAVFTAAQQAKLQELINQSYGKGASKAEKQYQSKIQELESEIEKLKGKGDEKKSESKGYDEETLKKLLDGVRNEYEPKLSNANQTIEKLKTHQRTAAVVSAAAKHKAVDPDIVAKLVGDAVGFDEDGALVVLDEKGQPRLNQKAEPMTVEEYVGSFLSDRPYLKQAANSGGAGSGSKGNGGGGQTFTRAQLNDPAFYQANRDAIHRALKEGRITD